MRRVREIEWTLIFKVNPGLAAISTAPAPFAIGIAAPSESGWTSIRIRSQKTRASAADESRVNVPQLPGPRSLVRRALPVIIASTDAIVALRALSNKC
jgi:hypothetical protein